jgi:hypothetical protein
MQKIEFFYRRERAEVMSFPISSDSVEIKKQFHHFIFFFLPYRFHPADDDVGSVC